MKKRITILTLSILLAASAAACGAQETAPAVTETAQTEAVQTTAQTIEGDVALPQEGAPEAQTQDAQAEASDDAQEAGEDAAASEGDGRFGPLFLKYVRNLVQDGEYTISMRQSGITMVTTASGGSTALDSNVSDVLHITMINKDGQYYMIMHNTSKYAELTAADYAKQADSLETATLELDNVTYKESGTDTVGGKQYSTETYDEGERGSVTYYFDDTGLVRAKVVKNGVVTDVESFTIRDEADMDMLTIPANYTKVSGASALWS